jgi:hypothetical protein
MSLLILIIVEMANLVTMSHLFNGNHLYEQTRRLFEHQASETIETQQQPLSQPKKFY